jgi:thiol-disulfide isomerase/thioredoxin
MAARTRALLLGLGLAGCATPAAPNASTSAPEVRQNSPFAIKVEGPFELTLPRYPGPGEDNLAGLKGKVLLVDFWATWCGPCHEAASAYQQLYAQLKGQGLEVYGVSVDEDTHQLSDFLAKQGVTYPILLDPAAEVSGPRFDISTIPTTLLVDRAGKVRFTHTGFNDAEWGLINGEVKQLLGEKP